MRKLRFKEFLLLGGMIIAFFSCQQSFDEEIDLLSNDDETVTELRTSKSVVNSKIVFMPVDSVPEWIKGKVSSEEYKLWKTMSSKFKIDYSILEYTLTPKQKETLYTTVSALARDIENGKITRYMGLFTAANLVNTKEAIPRRMLKNRTESGGDEMTYHDTGLHYICYFEDAKATIYVGAEYYIRDNGRVKYAVVDYAYSEVSSAYDISGEMVDASYVSTYQAIRFQVDGPLVYIHPYQGFTQFYFPTQELLVPISLN